MKKNETEKERRWLLKNKPRLKYDAIIKITQFYIDGYRYRCSDNKGNLTYESLKKVAIGIGHNEEVDIKTITPTEWQEKLPAAERIIKKVRYVKKFQNNTFEVDVLTSINLILMEIEGVEMSDVIDFPPEIQKELIMEVTGFKELSNYNLATIL